MKIILDTNIWISFLLGKRLSILVDLFSRNDIKIYVSEELINELIQVVARSKFSDKISSLSFDNLIELINFKCKTVSSNLEEECDIRDENDLFILGMAKNINADYVVTGDKDLLILEKFKNTQILTFSDFQKVIKS